MKTFIYRGYDRGGARVKGVVEALDVKDAREKLTSRAILPESVAYASDDAGESRWAFRNSHSLNQPELRAEFYRSVSVMLKAGLPLVSALDIQLEQTPPDRTSVARQLAGLRDHVRDGDHVVASMESASIPVSSFESAVLESGERTGSMSEVMEELADYLENVSALQQSVRTACLYPAIIVVLAIVVGTGVMGILVPRMAQVFTEAGMPLPLLTRIVVGAGTWFLPVILPTVLIALTLAVLAIKRGWNVEDTRKSWEQRVFRIPFFGTGLRTLVSLRFARTSSLLLRGGLALVESIRLAGKATGSLWLAGLTEEAAETVRQGAAFSRVLNSVPVLGPELGSWVRAGESSGDLKSMLHHASMIQQQKWNIYMERSVAIIEPMMIILVAVFVLLVALAILLPILSLNQQLV